jgi:hypothetical protein
VANWFGGGQQTWPQGPAPTSNDVTDESRCSRNQNVSSVVKSSSIQLMSDATFDKSEYLQELPDKDFEDP